jgi:hypothetical protein
MTDTILKHEGLKVLNEHLGPVGMERFLALMSHEQSDYTKWRQAQPDTLSVREYSKLAMDYQTGLN